MFALQPFDLERAILKNVTACLFQQMSLIRDVDIPRVNQLRDQEVHSSE